ncbi:hypothetical protein KO481_22500 [Nocardia sp. NEAU-G5]|uniref:DUF8020 domain-containing protein n=1 Tax=Nocardia albiluteola TaxID=2842303 RepID=A0ABS6B3E2_9NOCA|nr:hypothetical protein [Nocardia albiluteola]MBU3064290.1 hypothetical protein [Nocardia albiluteola]
MRIRKGTCAVMLAAGVAVATAANTVAVPSSAAPLPSQATVVPDTVAAAVAAGYRAHVVDGAVLATIRTGAFTLGNRSIELRDPQGAVKDTVPLSFVLDNAEYPIDAQISPDGKTLRMTPRLLAGHRVATPIASPLENQLAMNDLINSVSFGLSAGSLIGTVIGAVVGIGAGLVVSGASCLVLTIGCVLAVVPIVTLLGGVGGLAGLALGGAPGLIAGLWNYYTTMTAPPGHSKYADQLPGLPQNRQPQPQPNGAKR